MVKRGRVPRDASRRSTDRWRRRERRMLTMLKRHEVEILLKAGHRKAEVSRLTGVSLCSVKRIAQEGPVVHVDDAAERAQRQGGRPRRGGDFRQPVLGILPQKARSVLR